MKSEGRGLRIGQVGKAEQLLKSMQKYQTTSKPPPPFLEKGSILAKGAHKTGTIGMRLNSQRGKTSGKLTFMK